MPSPGLSSAAVLLVLVALTGKLAFVTLSKKQLQSTNGAVALLQAGGSTSLDRELSQLMKERTQLAHRYEVVSAAEHKREKAARHQKALLAHEHQELARLQHLKAEMGHKKLNGAKKTGITHMDEAAVRKMVHKEFQLEKRAAQRRHAQAEEAAREEKRKQALARHQLQAQEMQAEVRTEAKRELVSLDTVHIVVPAFVVRPILSCPVCHCGTWCLGARGGGALLRAAARTGSDH